MGAGALLGLVALSCLAAWMQTLTGFAFGLIMMGGVGLTGLMPLPAAAVLVSILVLVNAAQMLAKGWRDIALAEFRLILAASFLALPAGYWLLEALASTSLGALRLVLGCVIMASSLQLALAPAPLTRRSSSASFLFFGAVAGLMGGLFSTAGPPLVYHLYRQPLPLVRIRETLVAVFGLNAVLRLGMVAATGPIPSAGFAWSLLTIPAVMAGTHAARRWPPPLSPAALRRAAFVLLFLSGLSLALPSLLSLLGARP